VFIDKIRAFTYGCLPPVGRIKVDDFSTRQLMAALDAALLNPRDGPPGDRLRGLRTAAEDAVLQETQKGCAPVCVPDSFVSRFRKGDEDGKGAGSICSQRFWPSRLRTTSRPPSHRGCSLRRGPPAARARQGGTHPRCAGP
jgi:hypothetical protein